VTDYCHLELLCKLVGALKGLAKILGPWPTVVLAGLVLAFAALCADHAFLIVQMIVKAVFAAFFYWYSCLFLDPVLFGKLSPESFTNRRAVAGGPPFRAQDFRLEGAPSFRVLCERMGARLPSLITTFACGA
jgi:hypothetical protein